MFSKLKNYMLSMDVAQALTLWLAAEYSSALMEMSQGLQKLVAQFTLKAGHHPNG